MIEDEQEMDQWKLKTFTQRTSKIVQTIFKTLQWNKKKLIKTFIKKEINKIEFKFCISWITSTKLWFQPTL